MARAMEDPTPTSEIDAFRVIAEMLAKVPNVSFRPNPASTWHDVEESEFDTSGMYGAPR
jgi:hypothetical protein